MVAIQQLKAKLNSHTHLFDQFYLTSHEKSDRIGQIDEYDYLILPSAVEWQPYNDDNPDDLIAIKNFIEALKKGKKLYLKLSKEYKNAEGDWETNNSFNSNTYEFDLKGSSRALKFDY